MWHLGSATMTGTLQDDEPEEKKGPRVVSLGPHVSIFHHFLLINFLGVLLQRIQPIPKLHTQCHHAVRGNDTRNHACSCSLSPR